MGITKKMDIEGIPTLSSSDTTAEAFVLWTIDFRAWTRVMLIEDVVLERKLSALPADTDKSEIPQLWELKKIPQNQNHRVGPVGTESDVRV